MSTTADHERLGVAGDADERAIRRAYAQQLKLIDQAVDPLAFQSLREAYERALARARWLAQIASEAEHVDAEPDSHDLAASVPAQALVQTNAPEHQGDVPGIETAIQVQTEEVPPLEEDVQGLAYEPDPEQRVIAEACDGVFQLAADQKRPQSERRDALVKTMHSVLKSDALLPIHASADFEYAIASRLLGQGWMRGHDDVLRAAIAVFEWDKHTPKFHENPMLSRLLESVVTERAAYVKIATGLSNRVINELREGTRPQPDDLVTWLPVARMLVARFPNVMRVSTDVKQIALWEAMAEQLPPRLRARVAESYSPKAASKANSGVGFSGISMLIFLVIAVVRSCTASSDYPDSRAYQREAVEPVTIKTDADNK